MICSKRCGKCCQSPIASKDEWKSAIKVRSFSPGPDKILITEEQIKLLLKKRSKYPKTEDCEMLIFEDNKPVCLIQEFKPKGCKEYYCGKG
jgi:hypothetical protein